MYCESNTILGRTGFPWSQCFEEKNLVLEPASKDYEPLCYYKEPAESPLTDTEYPLVLTEGRLPMYHHGTLRNIPYLREIYPRARDVDPSRRRGDLRRGGRPVVHHRQPPRRDARQGARYHGHRQGRHLPGALLAPELLDTDPERAYRVMNINVLTKNDEPYNPEYGTYTLRGFQVKVTPDAAAPEGVWTEPEQFEPWMPQPSDPTEEVFDYGA